MSQVEQTAQGLPAPSEARGARKAPGGAGEARPPRRTRSRYPKLRGLEGADGEERRLCAVILEVLGGGRTPSEAAGAIGVSAARYYALEARALGGLLDACRRRPKGRRKTPQAELEKLRSDQKRLESQCARLQALVRASQRAVGLAPPPPPPKGKEDRGAAGGKKRRRARRPQVRALRAAKSLDGEVGEKAMDQRAPGREDAREGGS